MGEPLRAFEAGQEPLCHEASGEANNTLERTGCRQGAPQAGQPGLTHTLVFVFDVWGLIWSWAPRGVARLSLAPRARFHLD